MMHNTYIKPFKPSEYPEVTTSAKVIGLFNIQYKFENFTDDDEHTMDAWLCHNCTRNFIFFKETNQTIAGGHSNPLQDWEYRHSSNGEQNETMATHYIRLDNADRMLFEMVWLSDLQSK